jgi:hypothetical protein
MNENEASDTIGREGRRRPSMAEAADDLVTGAQQQAEATVDQGRRAAAGAAIDASEAIDDAATAFSRHGQETLSQAAAALSGRLQNIASYVESHSLDDLAREAQRIARSNPMLFIAGGVVVGLALGRLFKANLGEGHDGQRARTNGSGNGRDIDWNVDSAR